MKKTNNPAPANAKGYTDDDGNYVPTEAEVRECWPDIGADRDLSNDSFRMKIWRHPPTRNLVPFFTAEEAKIKQLNSAKVRSSNLKKYKEDKHDKAVILDILKEELNSDEDDLDPYRLLQLRSKMALLAEDWDKVEYLAMKMLEYTKPKVKAVDTTADTELDFGKASEEDMVAFSEGRMTYDEFMKKQKGD